MKTKTLRVPALALASLLLTSTPSTRVDPQAQEDDWPTAELIFDAFVQATGGKAAYAKLLNRVEKVTIEPVGSGMTFTMTGYYARPDKSYLLIEAAAIGKIEQGTNDGIAWESSSLGGTTIKEGAERDRLLRSGRFDQIVDWKALFAKAECVGAASIDGRPCHKVVLTPASGDPETRYYDKESGLVIKVEGTIQGTAPYEMFLSDYREVDGILLPHDFSRVSMGQSTHFTRESTRHNVDLPADRFELPDEVKALLTEGDPDLQQLNIESFDRVWSLINDHSWDPDFGGLDWQAVRDELRPRILEASTLPAAREVLRDMISRLQLSHFGIIPPELPEDPGDRATAPAVGSGGGETGLDARMIGGKALVTTVDEGSSADRLGVRTGWDILRIGDYDVVADLERLDRELPDTPSKRVKMAAGMVIRVRSGVGEAVAITFRNGEGEVVDLTIPFGAPRGRNALVGNFGHSRVRIDVRTIDERIGYIAVNKFLDPDYVMAKFNAGMESFLEGDGLILDLRGNSGGKDAMAMEMLGWLAPRKWVAGRLRTRGHEMEMTVQPRARTFEGPVVVLTDGLSGSSAEFVAAALQEIGRACVIGTRTKGEALPGDYTKLPNGDVFLYAVADFVTGEGHRLEGVGVAPDIEVALTQASLLEGRDLVLEAAVAWVRAQ